MKKWLYWVKMLIGVGLVWVLYQQMERRDAIVDAFRTTDWTNIVLCVVMLAPNMGLAFLKWRYLVTHRMSGVRNRDVAGSLFFGMTLGLVTPGRIGELGRGLFLEGRDPMLLTGLTILDKLANQIVIITLGWCSLAALGLGSANPVINGLWPLFLAGGVVIAAGWIVMLHPALLRRMLVPLTARLKPESKWRSLPAALDHFRRRDSLIVLALTITWFMVITLQYHILVQAFTEVNLLQSFQAVTATLFVKTLLPFTFGDLGIREGLAMAFYAAQGISEAAVFNASLLVFVINFLTPALAGLYPLLRIRDRRAAADAMPGESLSLSPSVANGTSGSDD